MRILNFAFIIAILTSTGAWANEDCAAFEAAMQGPVGSVIPRLDSSNRLVSLVVYGESTFISAKRSLIGQARATAELNAKRSFSEWISGENFSAEEQSQQLVETIELTNQDGQTAALATEISQHLNSMRSDTSAAIQGLVKLDECVNVEEQYIVVEYGWSPSLGAAAGQSLAGTGVGFNESSPTITENSAADESYANLNAQPASVGVSIVSIVVEGYGATQSDAINDALRIAVGQTFGEALVSEISSSGISVSLDVTDTSGQDNSSAVQQSVVQSDISTATSGFVESYTIIGAYSGNDQKITLQVNLPQYEPVIADDRIKAIVSYPILTYPGLRSEVPSVYLELLVQELEAVVNSSQRLSILDRSHTGLIDAELSNMSQASFSTAEYARFGNRLGADIILVPEVSRFQMDISQRRLAGRLIERALISSSVRLKAIDVASGNLLFSESIPLDFEARSDERIVEIFSVRHAHALGVSVATTIGGGINEDMLATIQTHSRTVDTYSLANERISNQRNELRDRNSSEW
jgi:hypothetical protein